MNKYQALVKVKSRFCKGQATKADVKRAASNYVHASAIKATNQEKGRKEAQKKANRVLRGGCSVSSVIAGKRRKGRGRKKRGTRKRH